MESKPGKVKKRKIKKPITFKKKFKKKISGLFVNRHIENSWEINVLICLFIVIVAGLILFLVFSPSIVEGLLW